jgi:hypothetical protein
LYLKAKLRVEGFLAALAESLGETDFLFLFFACDVSHSAEKLSGRMVEGVMGWKRAARENIIQCAKK